MNAAFLLVTTAWLTGADPVATPAPAAAPAPAMAAPASVAGGCGSCGCAAPSCDSCGCGHHGRLFGGGGCGLFSRHHGCGCETCAAPAPCCAPAPAPAPAPCCAAPAPTCDTCGSCGSSGCGHHRGLLSGLCRRHQGCGCETACNSCGGCDGCGAGSAGAPAVMPGPGPAHPEAVPTPAPGAKKMPAAPKSVQFNNTPETAPVPVSTPAFQSAPAIVPNVPADTDRKEPF